VIFLENFFDDLRRRVPNGRIPNGRIAPDSGLGRVLIGSTQL
jgi:hypothetical protein